MFLVDANVLSEATRPEPDARVLEWLTRHERAIVVDPVILGEILFGILLLPLGKRRARLERWFQDGVERIHCLTWEAATGLRWAQLLAELRASGQSMPIKDSQAQPGRGKPADRAATRQAGQAEEPARKLMPLFSF